MHIKCILNSKTFCSHIFTKKKQIPNFQPSSKYEKTEVSKAYSIPEFVTHIERFGDIVYELLR